jgi:arsenate reductase (thioredoxin)
MSNKPTVLILCTGSSCRSHIAEGILRQAAGDLIGVQSAGSKPAGYVHPKAIEVMREIGIDISGHRSKHLEEFLGDNKIETVITVCGKADQACPMCPGQVNRYHWGFDDPAKAEGTFVGPACRGFCVGGISPHVTHALWIVANRTIRRLRPCRGVVPPRSRALPKGARAMGSAAAAHTETASSGRSFFRGGSDREILGG